MTTVQKVKLPGLHRAYTDVLIELLKGEPLVDANGTAVLDAQNRPIYLRPKAAVLKEIREFLKDNGIDREPIDGVEVEPEATKALKQFEDDPLQLEGITTDDDPLNGT